MNKCNFFTVTMLSMIESGSTYAAPLIFSQDISSATYIAYSSDKNIVGFQLNDAADGTMVDGLPAL